MDSTANKPLPHCRAILLCEDIDEDAGTLSLHKLIESFKLPSFPGPTGPFAAFLRLYDGIGRYPMSIEVNALDNDTSVAIATLADLDFPVRLARIDVVIPVDFVHLPRAGPYELIVLVDRRELAREYFDAELDHDRE